MPSNSRRSGKSGVPSTTTSRRSTKQTRVAKQPLTPERIVEAAAKVADKRGIEAVSMRNVGKELGVEAMSLYHHIASKQVLLNAVADWIYSQIELPAEDDSWREGLWRRSVSVRDVLVRHPWALNLMDSQTSPGPAVLRQYDSVFGCMRRGGFSISQAIDALSLIDAYVFGFALTERNLPFDSSSDTDATKFVAEFMPPMDDYPHLAELVGYMMGGDSSGESGKPGGGTSSGDYRFSDQFADGLNIIFDDLERRVGS